ncbi:MAG: hypothetical protein NT052_01810 [Candidatus Shapirobacteria bacterium]|nr:hypothetical protein [Candidatus Shapirobacteria bacterium]
MWKERFKRLVIIFLVIVFLFFAGNIFTNWLNKKKTDGVIINLPIEQFGNKISDFGGQVLGRTVTVIPGANNLKEKLSTNVSGIWPSQTDLQTIVKNTGIETKTEGVIQTIKISLIDQIDKIKEQVFKNLYKRILGE